MRDFFGVRYDKHVVCGTFLTMFPQHLHTRRQFGTQKNGVADPVEVDPGSAISPETNNRIRIRPSKKTGPGSDKKTPGSRSTTPQKRTLTRN